MTPAAVGEETTGVANINIEGVTGDHESLHQEHAGTVSNKTISLHLTQPQSSVPAPALSGLPGEHRPWSSAATVHLVQHHVLQLLVIHRALVDVRLEKEMY